REVAYVDGTAQVDPWVDMTYDLSAPQVASELLFDFGVIDPVWTPELPFSPVRDASLDVVIDDVTYVLYWSRHYMGLSEVLEGE
ncbi:MAG: hypothetical protein ACRDQA_05370, partial [Nocardioidaceae bacterium]